MTKPHPVNAGVSYPFIYLIVLVQIRRCSDDALIIEYETDLADSSKRRVFAEQMSEAYAAGQYSIVEPIRVQRRVQSPG
ncbi:MAG: hypothetical protein KA760_11845 [Steroidobacteraceae bacterium]|nr:hypothetical protein [Steroidobacteraceae bacterium]